MHFSHNARQNLTIANIGLVCHDHEQKSSLPEPFQGFFRLRVYLERLKRAWRKTSAVPKFREDKNAITVEEHGGTGGHGASSPLGLTHLQNRVADETVPDNRLERLGQRRHPLGLHLRHDDDHVTLLRRVTGVLADNAEHFRFL